MKYYISFVEECVQNPLYLDYIGGRIEVHESNMPFSCKEIRFFTKGVKKFNRFRELWDMKDITGKQLKWIEEKVGKEFCKFPKKHEGMNGRYCPQCGQGINWKAAQRMKKNRKHKKEEK